MEESFFGVMEDEPTFVGAQAEVGNVDVGEEDDPGEFSSDEQYEDAVEQLSGVAVEVEVTPESINPPSAAAIGSDDFSFLKVLGVGGYGVVFLTEKTTGADAGSFFAMKRLSKAKIIRSCKDTAHTKAERSVLEIVNNPFIVDLKYAYQDKQCLYLVLEFCQGGELFTRLDMKKSFSEDLATFYAAEIALALGHLHSMDVVYRDLKPENVMLTADGHVKVTDFGLCKEEISEERKTHTFCGTIDYMAPEIVYRKGHDKSVDWWSLGTLLYDMITGSPPFTSNNRAQVIEKIKSGKVNYPYYLTNEAKSLMRALIKRDPQKRLGHGAEDVEALKRHPFFRHINWEKLLRKEIPSPDPNPPVFSGPQDLSMFDDRFTKMAVSQCKSENEDPDWHFPGFTYTDSNFLDTCPHPRSLRSPRKTLGSPSMDGCSPAKLPFCGPGPDGTRVTSQATTVIVGFDVPGSTPSATSKATASSSAASAAVAAAGKRCNGNPMAAQNGYAYSSAMNGFPVSTVAYASATIGGAAPVFATGGGGINYATTVNSGATVAGFMTNGYGCGASAMTNGFNAAPHATGYTNGFAHDNTTSLHHPVTNGFAHDNTAAPHHPVTNGFAHDNTATAHHPVTNGFGDGGFGPGSAAAAAAGHAHYDPPLLPSSNPVKIQQRPSSGSDGQQRPSLANGF